MMMSSVREKRRPWAAPKWWSVEGGDHALRARKRDAGRLVRGERVDELGARVVQRDGGSDDVGIARHPSLKAFARLCDLLLGERQPLSGGGYRLRGRREVEDRIADVGLDLDS